MAHTPITIRISVPREQDGVRFSDESWKMFGEELHKQGKLISIHHDHIVCDLDLSLEDGDKVKQKMPL